MDNVITVFIVAAVVYWFLRGHVKGLRRRQALALASAEKGRVFSEGPKGQHPFIDLNRCIGCATCTTVCPEGDVLAMLGAKAAIVNGQRCIGHGLCAEACPVGAITMVKARPGAGGDVPYLTPENETSAPNMFIIGELGGLALIKNAINQGRDCIDTIVKRTSLYTASADLYDVIIVGAGPAGISASLRAIEKKLNYLTIEQDEIGGTVAKYPRQKLVMTSPVELPMYGKFKKTEISKEQLLALWDMVLNRSDFNVCTGAKVEDIQRSADSFTVITATNQYRTRAVVLALGRTGTPRKLGVKGEELSKVMYRLIEADHYTNKRVLIVGGGDSAVEAAMGLAAQTGNKVTLSYRKNGLNRIKARNAERIAQCIRDGTVHVIFNSAPVEFTPNAVFLRVGEKVQELPNDFVWIFAGGEPPKAFLEKIGVSFSTPEESRSQRRTQRDPSGVSLAPGRAFAANTSGD